MYLSPCQLEQRPLTNRLSLDDADVILSLKQIAVYLGVDQME